MRDLASYIAPVMALAAAAPVATPTAVVLDLQGFDSAVLLLSIGAGGITFTGTNKIEFQLEHAEDNGSGAAGTYSNVTADDLYGADAPASVTGGIIKALTTAHATPDVSEFGYKGGKRFLRFTATFSGTHATGTPLAGVLVKGDPRNAPA